MSRRSLEERFWSKVNKNSGVFGADGKYSTECWEWIGAKCSDGYGNIKIDGKAIGTHRISWEMHYGPIFDVIMHNCDNPACVRPDHLLAGTQLENIKDRDNKNRVSRGIDHKDARLNPMLVKKIRSQYINQPNYNELGRQYGVSAASIRKVILRESWRHIL